MTALDLSMRYREYIACLNQRDWPELSQFVCMDVCYNEQVIGLSGYQEMLEGNCRDIPDLHFEVELLVCDAAHVASRLRFRCAPAANFLGLDVNGRTVSFTENVFYRFDNGKIGAVWSIVDKAAIEAQLRMS